MRNKFDNEIHINMICVGQNFSRQGRDSSHINPPIPISEMHTHHTIDQLGRNSEIRIYRR